MAAGERLGFHTRGQAHTRQSEHPAGKSAQFSPQSQGSPQPPIRCPECGSKKVWRDGLRQTATGAIQRFLCRLCGFRFSEFTAQRQVELNVSRQILKGSDPRKGGARTPRFGRDLSAQNLSEKLPFIFGENVGPHSVSIVAEGLNPLCSYNRSRRVSAEKGEAKNLATVEPQQEEAQRGATTKPLEADIKGRIVEFAWWLKKEGYRESTITQWTYILKALAKHGANLLDPESVKETIARLSCSENTKVSIVTTYAAFARKFGLPWKPLGYKLTMHLPFIPTETEVDQLIAGCGRKTSTFLQLLKETGVRSGEANRLEWTDIDFEKNTVAVNSPEKRSNPRIFKVSGKLIAMLNALPRTSNRVFGLSPLKTKQNTFRQQRSRLARQLQNPRLNQIHFHTLRHWKATMEYHKTKDILHVMKLLGHKKIDNTLIYTQLVNFESDDYTCRLAKTEKEVQELIEAGFEYVTDYGDGKFFRKRK